MARAVKRKRRADAPAFPASTSYKPSKERAARARANLEADRVKRRAILARTKTGRAQIAALAAGADMRDLDELPAYVYLTPPKHLAAKPVKVKPEPLPKIAGRRDAPKARKCGGCDGVGHYISTCPTPAGDAFRAAKAERVAGLKAKARIWRPRTATAAASPAADPPAA